MNESLSFGVLGATGKGVTEMYGVDVRDVEIVALSMAHSLASVGGLCIGTTQASKLLALRYLRFVSLVRLLTCVCVAVSPAG